MSPVLLNPFTAGNRYLQTVLADSPSIVAPLDAWNSPGFTDLSGNARDINVNGFASVPSIVAGSPAGGTPGVASYASTGSCFQRTTFTQNEPAVGTYEIWLNYAAAPAANLTLEAWSPNSGIFGTRSSLQLRTDGKLNLNVFSTVSVDLISPSALATNTWLQIIGSWGAAGGKIRVNKSTLNTNGVTTLTTPHTSSFRIHGRYNGSAQIDDVGAVKLAWAAFYPTQLSDARTDAHFDAA